MAFKGHKGHHHRGKRAAGGATGGEPNEHEKVNPGKDVYAGGHSNVVKEAEKRKSGGAAFGMKSKHHGVKRPGRARGGSVGSNLHPLTTAAKGTDAKGHKTSAGKDTSEYD